MKILDEFEIEGGIAIENYSVLCRDIEVGSILLGKSCTEGMEFCNGENIFGYLTGEDALLPVYAYNNGYYVYAKITAIRRIEKTPVLFASLHITHRGTVWGREKDTD